MSFVYIIMMVCLGMMGLLQFLNFVMLDGEIRQIEYWMLYFCAWIYLIGWFLNA